MGLFGKIRANRARRLTRARTAKTHGCKARVQVRRTAAFITAVLAVLLVASQTPAGAAQERDVSGSWSGTITIVKDFSYSYATLTSNGGPKRGSVKSTAVVRYSNSSGTNRKVYQEAPLEFVDYVLQDQDAAGSSCNYSDYSRTLHVYGNNVGTVRGGMEPFSNDGSIGMGTHSRVNYSVVSLNSALNVSQVVQPSSCSVGRYTDRQIVEWGALMALDCKESNRAMSQYGYLLPEGRSPAAGVGQGFAYRDTLTYPCTYSKFGYSTSGSIRVSFDLNFVPGVATPDQYDLDLDGVPNNFDMCPGTPMGSIVSGNTGCPLGVDEDSDLDRVDNNRDKCASTSAGMRVDADGCPFTLCLYGPAPNPGGNICSVETRPK